MSNKLITARKGYRKNKPFVLGIDRINLHIFDGKSGSVIPPPPDYQPFAGLNTLVENLYKPKPIGTSTISASIPISDLKSTGLGSKIKTGLASTAGKAALSALGTLGNKVGYKITSGGYNSGTGKAVSEIGNTVAEFIPNPMVGAAVKVASGVIGGGINSAVGKKINTEALAANNAGNAQLAKLNSGIDSLGTNPAVANIEKAVKYGWARKGKEKREYNQLIANRKFLEDLNLRNDQNIANNYIGDMIDRSERNYSAYGGPIDTAIGYSFMNLYLDNYNKKDNSNMTNLFAGTPNNMFDIGGVLQTKGGNYGNTTHIDAGESHEENPYQGVQLGVDLNLIPNLVEEGEVVWNDYVFSNRLVIPDFKKKYKNKKEAPYEALVLRPYSGKTFADAAKKIEKATGSDERSQDNIANRGLELELQILAAVLEKEREKEKLKEQQEAIDNMTPEEFAMLQQLMQIVLQLPTLEELAMQLQQMIDPTFMLLEALMLLPLEMAAYGGKLFAKGGYKGTYEDYMNTLQLYGILPNVYIKYQNQANDEALEQIDAPSFKKETAQLFLDVIKTASKKYDRVAKRRGINIDLLQGNAKKLFERERSTAIINSINQKDYNISSDDKLSFNHPEVSKLKNKQQAYINVATYNDLIARGGKAVQLDDLSRPMWESIAGLNRVNYGNLKPQDYYNNKIWLDENGKVIKDSGVDNYRPSTIDDENNLQLFGWRRGENGDYVVERGDERYWNPNKFSQLAGNSDTTYKPSDLGIPDTEDFIAYGADGYENALNNIQGHADYKKQTDKITSIIDNANGDYSKLPLGILNYLKYLDANTGNKGAKLLKYDEQGNIIGINDKASNLYNTRRNDNIYGIYHYQFDDGSADRYYYKDNNGDKVYVTKPDNFNESGANPDTVTLDNGITFNDYEISGINKDRTLTQLPTGQVVDVSDINDIDKWQKLNNPVLEDNTENLGYGVKGTTNWVDYSSSPDNKDLNNDNMPFPKYDTTADKIALGLSVGNTLFNALRPINYSNADAVLNAGREAGIYNPIEFRPMGNHLVYNPDDPWFYTAPVIAQSNNVTRGIDNGATNIAARNAARIANNYNTMNALGEITRKQLDSNKDAYQKTILANNELDKSWQEGFLAADKANQDAALRARGYSLDATLKGYAMRQALEDAKSNAINAGISSAVNMYRNMKNNEYNNNVLRWRLYNNPFTISQMEE